MNDPLSAARELIRAGAPVFVAKPCRPDCTWSGHAPGEGHGGCTYHLPPRWEQTEVSEDTLKHYRPGDALGMVCGHSVDAIDVDPRNKGTLAALPDGIMPRVYAEAATPSGGKHYLIKALGLRKVTDLVPGVDYQGGAAEPDERGKHGRGFVWIAPTTKPSKDESDAGRIRPYVWSTYGGGAGAPDADEILEWVDTDDSGAALADFIRHHKPAKAAPLADEFDAPDRIGSSDRTFTMDQAERHIAPFLKALTESGKGSIEENANSAAVALSHFVPAFWTPEEAYVKLELAAKASLGGTWKDGLSGWTLDKFKDVLDGTRPVADGWKARMRAKLDPPTELSGPGNPAAVARELVAHLPYRTAWWNEDYYRWTGSHWTTYNKSSLRRVLYTLTENAQYRVPPKKKDGDPELAPWAPTKGKVDNVLDALTAIHLHREDDEVDTSGIALANGVYEPATGALVPHTHERFNLHALAFEHDPSATAPEWLGFLESIAPGDTEVHDLLAEWFGYVLSGDTNQQKMLSLVGPTRCGKGTIARILNTLVGPAYVATPTLTSLSGTFGRQHLIGKKLAVLTDVRWKGRGNVAEGLDEILAITGEDARDVPRKNREDWHGKLGVRFMCMSNDPPAFTDSSGALGNRMIQIQLRISFLGREDLTLDDRLAKELPGIFNWAMAGLKRLRSRGRFTQPESGRALQEHVILAASPYQQFIEDCCDLSDPRAEEAYVDLHWAYTQWLAEDEGYTMTAPKQSAVAAGLASASERVSLHRGPRRAFDGLAKASVMTGIRLLVPKKPR
jgi:putative DNA primase/helicase